MDADRSKRESYYGKYAGTVKRLGAESHVVNMGISQNLVNAIPEFTTGQVVGGTKTALGMKPAPQKDTSTTHRMTLEVTSSKVVAIIDGKELSDCGYQVGVEGGGVARLISGDMDFSAVIDESTPDGKTAKSLLISLSDGHGNGGTLQRV
jgi:hypothetical protein